MTTRAVSQILLPTEERIGDYLDIKRGFPSRTFAGLDPFLLIDHAGPLQIAAGSAATSNAHPHRGFEAITYVLQGELAHADSKGHRGTLCAGALQRMTAGSGIVHDESPGAALLANGGRLELVQLWVNLARPDKMRPAEYQDVAPAEVPIVELPGVTLRVLAGDVFGVRGPVRTRQSMLYVHATIAANRVLRQPLDDDVNAAVFVLGGTVSSAGRLATADQCIVFSPRGGDVVVSGVDDTSDVLLIAGEPLREPVARWGPFVMNTREEIVRAVEEYRAGAFGDLAP